MTALALTAGDLLTGLLMALVLAAVVFAITRVERHPAEKVFDVEQTDWLRAGPEDRERVDERNK